MTTPCRSSVGHETCTLARSRPSVRAAARLVAVLAALSVVVLGCSSSGKSTTGNTTLPSATPSAATSSSQPPATASAGSLSGTWSGRYSGEYSGTFTLTWTQTGSTLAGTIKLSTSASPLDINGTINGSSIRFGTVGGAAVTYTGTVSGGSMSGSYTAPNSTGGTGSGSWSATKTS